MSMKKRVMRAEHIVHFRFGWPVGMKLRLRPANQLPTDYAHLGGTAVIVTAVAGDPMDTRVPRQFVYLMDGRDERFSTKRVRPQDLELIPNIDPHGLQTNQAIVDELPDWWVRTLRPKCGN